ALKRLKTPIIKELRLEAYDNSYIYKQRFKQFHDHQILRKGFHVGQKVLLFKSRLRLIAGKFCSKSDNPFIITKFYSYGAIELQDELTRSTFQANRQQLKIFHEGPTTTVGELERISLANPATLISDFTLPITEKTILRNFEWISLTHYKPKAGKTIINPNLREQRSFGIVLGIDLE
ncbi:hypothetical protein CR513_51340, partial [Mucuna pruriens]